MTNQQSADVVIITALEKERDAVLHYLDQSELNKLEQVQFKNRIVHKFSLRHDNMESSYQVVLLCIGNMGNTESAVETSAILDLNPNIIILTGIAGGVENQNERCLGDLMIPDQIVYYEQGKITNTGTKPRYKVLSPDYALLQVAKNFSFTKKPSIPRPDGKDKLPNIHIDPVASGEKVIADTQTIPGLQNSWTKLIGIEMESFGVALAAYKAESRPRFLMVKGICDWANPDKNDQWQEYAAHVAAMFVIDLLRGKPFSSQPHKEKNLLISTSKSSIDLYNRLRRLPKPLFNDISFYLKEQYDYDLSFIEINGTLADVAHQLIELLKQYPQGLNHLQQLLEERRLL